RLLGARPAWRALAAGFILEEAHEIEGGSAHVVFVGEDDDGRRADEAAVFFKRAEIERDVRHRCRQDTARGSARQIRRELVSVAHAAAILVDELLHRDSGGREFHAGILDASGDREGAQARTAIAAVTLPPGDALLDEVANPEQRLDIVDERRTAEQADLKRK